MRALARTRRRRGRCKIFPWGRKKKKKSRKRNYFHSFLMEEHLCKFNFTRQKTKEGNFKEEQSSVLFCRCNVQCNEKVFPKLFSQLCGSAFKSPFSRCFSPSKLWVRNLMTATSPSLYTPSQSSVRQAVAAPLLLRNSSSFSCPTCFFVVQIEGGSNIWRSFSYTSIGSRKERISSLTRIAFIASLSR